LRDGPPIIDGRMKRPEWFEPPHGPGDWFALVLGVLLAAGTLALVGWVAGRGVERLAEGKLTFSEATCIDFTDPCNWSSYRVFNDTHKRILVRECDDRCQTGDGRNPPILVEADRLTRNDVYEVRATVKERDWWLVESRTGRQIGCLVLDGHPLKHDGDIVRASSTQPCSVRRATPIYRVAR
jgi:hypothetical protein